MQDSELPGTSSEVAHKRVDIQKIYAKDISYETVDTPRIFAEQGNPKITQEMNVSNTVIDEECYEVVLTVTMTVKINDKTAYLIEVNQAGIFNLLGGHTPEETKTALAIFCPTVLFPYAREAISDLSARGGFPPLVLQHVNFLGMYQGYLQKNKEAKNKQALKKDGGDTLAG